jgi:gamma-glutamylcyclotransferase
MAQGKEVDGNPSLRYITLLRDGARAHNSRAHREV